MSAYDRDSLIKAIAEAIARGRGYPLSTMYPGPTDEASWCDGLQIEPPPERQLVTRYIDAGEPDDTSWGVASHEWDDRIEREL